MSVLNEIRLRGLANQKPDLDLWIGYSYLGAGDYEKAQETFEAICLNDDNDYLALDGLGCALSLLGNHTKAVEKFKKCIKINDGYGLAHLHLSRSLDEMGQADASRQKFREAIIRDPLCIIPQKEVMEKLLAVLEYETVMHQSMKLLDVLPHDVDAKLILGKALRAKKRHNEALHLLSELVTERPDNGPAKVLMGHLYLDKGMFADADRLFNEASVIHEGDNQMYYAWGKTLTLLGMHELALEKYEKAAEIDPYDGDTYEAWGSTLKSLGRFAEAAEVYKRASQYILM